MTDASQPAPRPTARPAPARNWFSHPVRWICLAWLKLTGWKLIGDWPDDPRVVLVAAPHTSNWDGLNMLAAAGAYRVKLRWMGKASLVRPPFGGLMRWLGCVPVDRANARDVVAQMADAFASHDRLILAVAPEGTRATTSIWKSGFHRIAVAANVPLLITILNYGNKTITVAGLFHPSNDYVNDLPKIQEYYAGATGKKPTQFNIRK